jgi:hypothetical protein
MKLIKNLSLTGILSALVLSASVFAEAPTNVNGLVGTWVNTDSSSSGIVKVVVSKTRTGGISFKSYGACSPTPCVHSTVTAQPYAANVSSEIAVGFYAYRNSGFKYARFFGKRVGSYLKVDSFSTFASGDSRSDYTNYGYFKKL